MRGWEEKQLAEVCQFTSGLWKGIRPPFVRVGVIRATNFTKDGILDDSDIAHIDVEAKQFKTRRLQFGDIVLEKSGGGPKQPVGRVIFFDKKEGDFSFSNFTSAMRVRDSSQLDPRYLHKYLHWIHLSGFTEKIQSNSIALRNLDGNAYKAIRIAYPSINEQQRIVGILDKAFEGIAAAKANAEKNLQNARELLLNHREAVFSGRDKGWVSRPLSDLCDVKHGFAFKSQFFASKGRHVLLTPGNFFESGGYRDRGTKQKYFNGDVPAGYILAKGDLLVAMTEQAAGLLGSPILIPDSDKFLHNQRLGLVVGKPGIAWENGFFFHAFNTQAVRREIHATASGVKVRHTSPSKIGKVVVSFPDSISKQIAIIQKFDELGLECRRLESVCRQKFDELSVLKNSILHQAFSGSL